MENIDIVIDGCTKQNPISQQKVFELYYDKMLIACSFYVKDKHTAKDIVQESFIKAFNSFNTFTKNTPSSLYNWLKRIVVNKSIDFLRSNKLKSRVCLDDIEFKHSTINDEEIKELHETNKLKAELALKAIAQLSPAYKKVFIKRVLEEKPHQTIADELGISVSSSKTNYMKAKAKLAKILKIEYKVKELLD